VWALACTAVELLRAEPLFDGDSEAVLRRIHEVLGSPGVPPCLQLDMSDQLADFLQKSLQLKPEARLCAQQACSHEFLQERFRLKVVCDRLPAQHGEMSLAEGEINPRLLLWLKGGAFLKLVRWRSTETRKEIEGRPGGPARCKRA
jgi:serine/threonine protein kinase